MKKVAKLFLVAIAFVVSLSTCLTAFASNSEYYINSYNVDIVVDENNTLHITENINAVFNQPKHGIYRYIPLSNNVQRADGTSGKTHAKVTNISVSDNYEQYNENGNTVIQIGDEDIELTGEKSYTISYDYVMGKDIGDGFDELYYNIIGDGWDTTINNVTFSIQMPKAFDESELGFSSGTYKTIDSSNVVYTVDGNTITGYLTNALSENEALTVRLELDEGYFTFDMNSYIFTLAIMIILPALALLVVIALWAKFGRDKKVVDVVEFYPPENMNSQEVALWYKGRINTKDTVALLIELANEGYIAIHELEDDTLHHNAGDYEIQRKRYYRGSDKCKQIFFDGLFKSGKDKVYLEDLKYEFCNYAAKIVAEVNQQKNIEKIFNSKSLRLRFVGWAISIFSGVISALVLENIIGGIEKYICFGIGILICVASFVLSFFIRQRTQEGYEMLQKINGFKIFLETAEKERLEAMVNDNPEYYYDLLPFAYVLGVSEKWTKQFEGIVLPKPEWYYGTTFNHMTMYRFIDYATYQATEALTSVPESSSSGGGFSGGGSGGGGGGSW